MREVRLTARGHPAVTGRHDKTLELTAEDAITARATCILGVAAGPLPGDLPALRGTVRLTLAAGGVSASVEGVVNPGYASPDRLVVRRSDLLEPDTFLVDASAAAADLPADLLAALRTSDAAVQVTVTETGTPPPVVLVLLPGAATAAVARLATQADVVVDLTARGAPPPSVRLAGARQHGVPRGRLSARTVTILAPDLGTPTLQAVAAVPGARVEVWPPAPGADLLLGAGLPPTPLLHAGPLPPTPAARRDLARRLAATALPALLDVPPDLRPPLPDEAKQSRTRGENPSAARTPLLDRSRAGGGDLSVARPDGDPSVMRTPLLDDAEQRLARGVGEPRWLGEVRAELVGWRTVVPDGVVGWGVGARVVGPGEPVGDLRGLRHAPRLVLVPPDGPRPVPVDPAELARLLRAAGRSGRDAAAVLSGLGVPRKDAYRLATDGP